MADPIGTVSGLASGIQWRDMIDEIIKVESAPIDRLNTQISATNDRSSAWSAFKTAVQAWSDAAQGLADGSALGKLTTSVSGGAAGALSVSAGDGAAPGNYQVVVDKLAAAEKLSGQSFASGTDALGLSGEFIVNGIRIEVSPPESLSTIAKRISESDAGVQASVVSTVGGAFRIVLSSQKTGAAGIELADGPGGVLSGLGLLDGTTSTKTLVSNGALGDGFSDSTTKLAALLGLTGSAAGTVTLGDPTSGNGGVSVALDLGTMSLGDVASAINAAATAQGSAISASVEADTVNGRAVQRLRISNTTQFQDSGHVLELLGVVEGGRSSVAQQLQGGALVDQLSGGAVTSATSLANLGAEEGETIGVSGTRGDGSAFSFTYTVQGDGAGNVTDTVQSFLDALNASGALAGSGSAAAASLVTGTDGRQHLAITDDATGASRLSLSLVANNEHGGTLDFGTLATTRAGLSRVLTAGSDAEMTIDGAYVRRSTNSISDVIPGLTFNLASADPNATLDVAVDHDVDASVAAVKALVTAYNKVADFVSAQQAPPADGQPAPPLFSDSVLRSMRDSLKAAMQRTLAAGVAGSWTRLADVGIAIDKTGHFTVDDAKLNAAVAADPEALSRLFGLSGTTTSGALGYVTAGDKAQDGTYAVQITAPASAAGQTGSVSIGASGYAAAGAGDAITVKDIGSGKSYTVALAAGEGIDQIVSALNSEFATPHTQQLTTARTLSVAPGGAAADDSTTWASTYDAVTGGPAAATGDVFTLSGRRADGSSFTTTYVVGDAATSTLGELRDAAQRQFGADATVAWSGGRLVVTAANSGSSLVSLNISSSATANPNPLGTVDVTTEGRSTTGITASKVADPANPGSYFLRLDAADFGSNAGFAVSYAGNGLGLGSTDPAGVSYTGTDVQGTIGGLAATGSGRTLTGAAGTAVEGLILSYDGSTAGSAGSITFSRGIGSAASLAAAALLGTGASSIDALTQRLGDTVSDYNKRIDDIQARLDRRRDQLTQQFTAMEQAISQAQTQMQWLTGQINSLQGMNTSQK